MSAVCPNSSVAVSTTVWLSVPNLSIPTTRGRTQSSGAPPSNEHVTDTTLLVKSQSNLCVPGTPVVPHTPVKTARRMRMMKQERECMWIKEQYQEGQEAPELQIIKQLDQLIQNPHSKLTFNQSESKLSTENLSIHVHHSQE